MGGIGNFFDPRIDVAVAFDEDIVTPKLPALYEYQVSLAAPVPDPVTAERSATGLYRTTPLRALLAHPPYFHDGSAETLADVVAHYDTALELELTADDKADLVQYLNSL